VGPLVIGVDLGGTNLRTALVNHNGEVTDKDREPSRVSDGQVRVVQRLVEKIKNRQLSALRSGSTVTAVGVGAPGVIHAESGVVVKSPNFPDWNNLSLKRELETSLSLPVFIENDANAAALGELWRGAGRGITSMILLTLGTGVGGGIVLDGRIWPGADGMAGEIGHMTIIPDGRRCGCGNTGCLEMYASSRGIVMTYHERSATTMDITSEGIYRAARDGDELCGRVMKDMGSLLGIGIANLINIFNPEMVVIGGGVKEAWPLFIEATRDEIKKRAFEYPASRTQIVPSMLGDDAGLVGAAALALQKMNMLQ